MLQDSLEDMKMICLFYFKIHGYINLYQVNICISPNDPRSYSIGGFGHLEKTTLCPKFSRPGTFYPTNSLPSGFPASKTGGVHPPKQSSRPWQLSLSLLPGSSRPFSLWRRGGGLQIAGLFSVIRPFFVGVQDWKAPCFWKQKYTEGWMIWWINFMNSP